MGIKKKKTLLKQVLLQGEWLERSSKKTQEKDKKERADEGAVILWL